MLMKIINILTLGLKRAPVFCHYQLSLQAFAKLSDAEQELVISFCGYIPFSQSQNFSRSTPVHYFDVVLEWQVI